MKVALYVLALIVALFIILTLGLIWNTITSAQYIVGLIFCLIGLVLLYKDTK